MLVVSIENASCFPRVGVTIETGVNVQVCLTGDYVICIHLKPSSSSERPSGQINNWHARLD